MNPLFTHLSAPGAEGHCTRPYTHSTQCQPCRLPGSIPGALRFGMLSKSTWQVKLQWKHLALDSNVSDLAAWCGWPESPGQTGDPVHYKGTYGTGWKPLISDQVTLAPSPWEFHSKGCNLEPPLQVHCPPPHPPVPQVTSPVHCVFLKMRQLCKQRQALQHFLSICNSFYP